MDKVIITTYCLIDDYLQEIHHVENKQCQMSDAEILTTAIVAAMYFGGNYALAQRFMSEGNYVPKMLSRSRFSRRLNRVKSHILTMMAIIASIWKELNADQIYIVDAFPIPVCDNCRITRCRLYQDESFRGYQRSKRRYFYGLKLHLLVTEAGHPVEFFLTPGSYHDGAQLLQFDLDLPDEAIVLGDKAYNIYWFEDLLAEVGIDLIPQRKLRSKRPLEPWQHGLHWLCRRTVETTGSLLERILPKHIHATSSDAFELKVVLFLFAVSLNQFIPLLM